MTQRRALTTSGFALLALMGLSSGCGSGEELEGAGAAQTAAEAAAKGKAKKASDSAYQSGAAGAPSGGGERDGCTFTQGYWKNHESAWPVSSLKLGDVTYSKAQLLAIFAEETRGNGLVSMSHQLIAARLNIANGASLAGLEATLSAADAKIGARVVPPVGKGSLPAGETSALNDKLTAFNEGRVGPGHCEKGGGSKPQGGGKPQGGSGGPPPGQPNGGGGSPPGQPNGGCPSGMQPATPAPGTGGSAPGTPQEPCTCVPLPPPGLPYPTVPPPSAPQPPPSAPTTPPPPSAPTPPPPGLPYPNVPPPSAPPPSTDMPYANVPPPSGSVTSTSSNSPDYRVP